MVFVAADRRVIPVEPGDVLRRVDDANNHEMILDFRGVIITRGRFFELLRYESFYQP